MTATRFDALLFDFDGVILESVDIKDCGICRALR